MLWKGYCRGQRSLAHHFLTLPPFGLLFRLATRQDVCGRSQQLARPCWAWHTPMLAMHREQTQNLSTTGAVTCRSRASWDRCCVSNNSNHLSVIVWNFARFMPRGQVMVASQRLRRCRGVTRVFRSSNVLCLQAAHRSHGVHDGKIVPLNDRKSVTILTFP